MLGFFSLCFFKGGRYFLRCLKLHFFWEKIPRITLVTCARGRDWSYWNCWPSPYDLVVWRSTSVFRRKIGIVTVWTGMRDFRNRDSSCDQQNRKLLGFLGCPDFLVYKLIGRVSERCASAHIGIMFGILQKNYFTSPTPDSFATHWLNVFKPVTACISPLQNEMTFHSEDRT